MTVLFTALQASIFQSLFYYYYYYSHYSGTKVKKKNENIRNCRKRIDRNYTTICTIFESVCKSQSSKAFELAATNLQVKKGLGKERNNN